MPIFATKETQEHLQNWLDTSLKYFDQNFGLKFYHEFSSYAYFVAKFVINHFRWPE